MGLETTTYIDGLVSTNPVAGDNISQGDDHIRLLKSTIKSTFPNVSGAVTPTHTELNYVDGVTSAIQTQLDAKAASGANTDLTSVYLNNTGLKIKDTNASHGLIIAPGSDLTVDRTLTLTTGDAARTLTISGDATVSQDYSTTGNPQFATIELGAATDTTISRSSAGVIAVEGVTVPLNSTTSSHTASTIELGHATDTTIARASAGVISVEGNHVPSPASQAQGDVLYHNGTTWARLGAGTSGQYLKTNGTGANPAWADATGGAWTLIGTSTASNVATLDITGLSSYKIIRISFYNVVPTVDGRSLYLRLSSDNGSSFLSSNYSIVSLTGGAGTFATSTGNAELVITDAVGNVSTDGPASGTIILGNFNQAAKTTIISNVVHGDSGANLKHWNLWGFHTGSTAMNAIRFLFSTGNLSTGTFIVEGLTQ